ncbi:MAG: DNA lyase [Rhodocyclaceae bacterium]|nr:MAG: DNA lyase [Rhodocyclaceae bacterium]
MRLWSLHPKYLDSRGLVALWREALLAQAVLRGLTRGYQHHPQLTRFRAHKTPIAAIGAYLAAVHDEAMRRDYEFDKSKIDTVRCSGLIPVTSGQIDCEWDHLLRKLAVRDPARHDRLLPVQSIDIHPQFRQVSGGVEPWERNHP